MEAPAPGAFFVHVRILNKIVIINLAGKIEGNPLFFYIVQGRLVVQLKNRNERLGIRDYNINIIIVMI